MIIGPLLMPIPTSTAAGLARPARAQRLERSLHGERGAAGVQRMIRLRQRRAEHRHEAIADELVEHAAVLEQHAVRAWNTSLSSSAKRARLERGGEPRRVAEVGEQDAQLLLLAAEPEQRGSRATWSTRSGSGSA